MPCFEGTCSIRIRRWVPIKTSPPSEPPRSLCSRDLTGFFLLHVKFPTTTRTFIGCEYLDPSLQVTNLSPVIDPLKQLLAERAHALNFITSESNFNLYQNSETVVLTFQGFNVSLEGPNIPFFNPNFTFPIECNTIWNADGPRRWDILPESSGRCGLVLSMVRHFQECHTLYTFCPQKQSASSTGIYFYELHPLCTILGRTSTGVTNRRQQPHVHIQLP